VWLARDRSLEQTVPVNHLETVTGLSRSGAAMSRTPSRGTSMMNDSDVDRKLDELDRLLNDPTVSLEPARVWSLLAEVSTLPQRAV
jgi:hypothetical protein